MQVLGARHLHQLYLRRLVLERQTRDRYREGEQRADDAAEVPQDSQEDPTCRLSALHAEWPILWYDQLRRELLQGEVPRPLRDQEGPHRRLEEDEPALDEDLLSEAPRQSSGLGADSREARGEGYEEVVRKTHCQHGHRVRQEITFEGRRCGDCFKVDYEEENIEDLER